MRREIDTLAQKQEPFSEELLRLAELDPYVIVALERFCVGPRLNNWFHALPVHWGARFTKRYDHLTLSTTEQLVHGFGLCRSSALRT